MSILTQLSLVAVRYVVSGACKATGLPASGDEAVDFLAERFTDQGQRLPKAINAATERAWKTLELTLAGDTVWSKLTTRAEDRALAQELRLALVVVKYDAAVGDKGPFFRACLKELRAVRRLPTPPLHPDELQRHTRAITGYANPAALVEDEWRTAGAMADECDRLGHKNLAQFLRLGAGERAGELPFLTVAVRYYFRRAVEQDEELARGLTFAQLSAVSSAQERQFVTLAETLDRHSARLEGMLADVLEDVGYIRENMATRDDVARIMRDALAQAGVINAREVVPSATQLVQSDQGRSLLLAALQRFRELPPDVQRANPELFDMAGRIGMMTGDYEQAQAAFAAVPDLSRNTLDQAQAHHNAYLAALEQGAKAHKPEAWVTALGELVEAARLDPQRFTPFDLGKYEPVRILGAGGFGVTFLCRNRTTEGHRAVKTLYAEQLDDARRQRVLEEGKVLEQIQHPNIVRIFDIEFAARPDQRPYFVMEYCDGFQTLEQYVAASGKLKPADLREVARQIAEGLKAAHDKGVLHRDIKPANVLVRRDGAGWQVRLIDFGLALRGDLLRVGQQSSKAGDAVSILSREIAGTRAYAPPEQMDGERQAEVGTHSDIYSFGKTCYYALFQTPDPDDDEKQNLPPGLRAFLSRCTAGTISKRPAAADELVKAFGEKDAGRADPVVNTMALKVAGASLLPGMGHIMLGQSVKGGIFLGAGLLFLLGWWQYVALIVGGLLLLGGLPVLGIAAIAALSGGIGALTDTKGRRIALALASVSVPFLLLPAVLHCPWPTLYLGWALIAAADAALAARTFWGRSVGANTYYVQNKERRGPVRPDELAELAGKGVVRDDTKVWVGGLVENWVPYGEVKGQLPAKGQPLVQPMPNWTLFGAHIPQLDPRHAGLSAVGCVAAVLVSLFVSNALFGPPAKYREWIVGTWDLERGETVEFTSGGAVLIQKSYGTKEQARFRLVGRSTLEIKSSRGLMESHTDRYTVEFTSQNEMVLVAQERGVFDGHDRDPFPQIAGKLTRANTASTGGTGSQPDPKLLGRWVKGDSRNDASEVESVVLTAGTMLYAKPKVRMFGMDQYTTQLTWLSETRVRLKNGNFTVQFDIVSDKEIIVSSQNGTGDFRGIDGHYRRAEGEGKRGP